MNIHRYQRILATSLVACCLLMTGCETTRSYQNTSAQLIEKAEDLSRWQLKGKIAITSRQQTTSVAVDWTQHDKDRYQMRLNGPIGSGSAVLQGSSEQVTLKTSKGEEHKAKEPDSLAAEVTGQHVPVRGLFYWIRGIPQDSAKARILRNPKNGRIQELEENGWTIRYLTFEEVGRLTLPTSMMLQFGTAMTIKLAITRWQI